MSTANQKTDTHPSTQIIDFPGPTGGAFGEADRMGQSGTSNYALAVRKYGQSLAGVEKTNQKDAEEVQQGHFGQNGLHLSRLQPVLQFRSHLAAARQVEAQNSQARTPLALQ